MRCDNEVADTDSLQEQDGARKKFKSPRISGGIA